MPRKKTGSRVKKDTKTITKVTNSEGYESDENEKHVRRQDNDEIDEFYIKKDRILLQGRDAKSPDSEPEQIYALSSEEDEEEDSEEENELLNEDYANDMVARFVKKREINSDIEDEENDTPDAKAWGRKRQDFYDNDYNVKDTTGVTMSEHDRQVAKMEEEEALAIQKRLADEVDEDVFGLDDLQNAPEERESSTNIESFNIHKLPRKKLLRMIEEESPELQELIDDCRDKLCELDQELAPILALYESEKLPRGTSAEMYFLLRHNLLLNYTTNVCFYLSLKAKRVVIKNHPIIKRLGQFKRLITELDSTRDKIRCQTLMILEKASKGESFKTPRSFDSQKRASSDDDQDSDEQESDEQESVHEHDVDEDELRALGGGSKRTIDSLEQEIQALYHGIKASKKLKVDKDDSELDGEDVENNLPALFQDDDSENDGPVFLEGKAGDEDDEDNEVDDSPIGESVATETSKDQDDYADDNDERRAINYQIAKNKGLTPKRKKEYRNPRVRHRIKYRKANIRRKGQVRAMRNEAGHYGGEMSGINKQVVKSIKLK